MCAYVCVCFVYVCMCMSVYVCVCARVALSVCSYLCICSSITPCMCVFVCLMDLLFYIYSYWSNMVRPYCLGNGFISLESVQAQGHYIGVNDGGNCKSYLSGGISDDERFYVLPVQPVSDWLWIIFVMCQK